MLQAVTALGIVEIIAWGTTFYALGVLGGPIAAETGWSRSLVFGGMSVGLLVSSASSTYIGKLIDRYGARHMMALGSALSAAGLVGLSLAYVPAAYLAAWLVLGPAMRLTLYDAAFAALVQVAPSRGRRAISYLTLFGGFASTVFWPIGHWLAETNGWRTTVLVFAALNIACLPLIAWGLRRSEQQPRPPSADESTTGDAAPHAEALKGSERLIAMALFATMIAANSFVFGALSAHLVAVLQSAGLAAAAAVGLASLKGAAQVVGRLWEIFYARGLSALGLGRVAISLLPLSFLVLMLGGANFEMALLFTLLLGASNGLVTIVRGAVPLALFGVNGFGAMLGLLATPQLLMNALSPIVFAAIVDAWGPVAGEFALLAAALISMAAMELMSWWYFRRSLSRQAAQA